MKYIPIAFYGRVDGIWLDKPLNNVAGEHLDYQGRVGL